MGISGLDVIRTSETENSANLGQIPVIDNSFSYTLSKESVTTFTGKLSSQVNLPPEPPTGLKVANNLAL